MEIKDFWELQGAGQTLHCRLREEGLPLRSTNPWERWEWGKNRKAFLQTLVSTLYSCTKPHNLEKISGLLK